MELDPRAKIEATDLSRMALTEICVNVARKAANICGLDGDISENVLTWAIDIEPPMASLIICSLGEDARQRYLDNPGWCALCGDTAKRLFIALATSEGVAGVFEELASDVGRATTGSGRTVFHVQFSNHEFIVVVRNGIAEILQSFQTKYSLGWCLQQSKPYDPERLQRCLINIATAEIQKELFFSPLLEDITIAAYTKAPLKSDEEIWQTLFERAKDSLTFYQSIR